MAIDYAKLAEDLKAARDEGFKAAESVSDGGSCNLDNVVIRLPRARRDRVDRAAREAGMSSSHQSSPAWARGFAIHAPRLGMGGKNTAQAEAMAAALKSRGWDAHVFYLTD